uniref:C3H1-type domain-containing protein n=1 Tax=Cannabis sativa TaxID=3483 RepID=A0A803P2K6_CANSA
MMKGINPSCVYDFSDHHFSGVSAAAAAAADYNDRVDDAIYGSDEFRMYAYKIKRCPRMRSHDWTECPYAHRGEKAQRRDPRKFNYSAIVCPAFRNGASCSKGDTCEFAHGVFEYWLHPARYRTRACNSGQLCQRKVCFFAHSPDQLRPETKSKRHSHFAYRPTASAAAAREPAEVVLNRCGSDHLDHKFADFLKSLRALKIRDLGGDNYHGSGGRIMNSGLDVSESDLPHVEWISKLVQ